MPDLIPILADFMADIERAAYPDLMASVGESCIFLVWKSHTLTAWVDMKDDCGITITYDVEGWARDGGENPLDTVARLIAQWIDEQGCEIGEGENDALPGTFAARVWVAYNQAIIDEAQATIARLDPEGRYSVNQTEPLVILTAFTDDDTTF
jgi:hypothetical protein